MRLESENSNDSGSIPKNDEQFFWYWLLQNEKIQKVLGYNRREIGTFYYFTQKDKQKAMFVHSVSFLAKSRNPFFHEIWLK